MMELKTVDGDRLLIEPSHISAIAPLRDYSKKPPELLPGCTVFVGGTGFPVTFSIDAMHAAIQEYFNEMELKETNEIDIKIVSIDDDIVQ